MPVTPEVRSILDFIEAAGGPPPDDPSPEEMRESYIALNALASRPEVIFADEPTGNLDSNSGQEVLGFLRRAVDDWHQTVVMVTHDPSAAATADVVLFLRDGDFVGALENPTADDVLDRIRQLEV